MATKVTWPPNFLILAFRLISIRRNVTKINYNSLDLVSTSSSSLKVKFSLVRIEYNSFAKASLSGLYGLINL